MSLAQRRAIDAQLRHAPRSSVPQEIGEMRVGFAAMMAAFAVPGGVRTSELTLTGRPALLVEPEQRSRPGTILYFHGGSYSLGSPQTALCLTANLAMRTGMRAVSLDYRLAPEHPFPAAIDDCLAAYTALLDGTASPGMVALAGDSAGGGLAVATTLAARAADLPLPAAIVTFSAFLDYTLSGASIRTKAAADPLLTPAGLTQDIELYLAGQAPDQEVPDQELLAPAVSADLAGFPPLLLQVGTNELLLDDSVRLAQRARDAEVDVILDITAGVPHVFQTFAGQLDEADQALDRAALFLGQHLAPAAGC